MKRYAALALGGLLVACSSPGHPTPTPASSNTNRVAASPTGSPTVVVSTVPTPTFQKGIAIYWKTEPGETLARVRTAADQAFDYAISLGANSVSLSFPFFVDGTKPTRVYSTDATPTPAMADVVFHEAATRHLLVNVRPLLDEDNLAANGWRGSIAPVDLDSWFTSYETFLQPYLASANSNRVAMFTVNTELNSLADDAQWSALVAWAHTLYHGAIHYSANRGALTGPLFTEVDSWGVDAYFDTTLSDTASVEQLTAAWNQWLATQPFTNPSQLVYDEVGIPAEPGAYGHTTGWGDLTEPLDETVQANWFSAACDSAKQNHLAGIYFWRINFGDNFNQPPISSDRDAYSGRQAAQSIKQCFTS